MNSGDPAVGPKCMGILVVWANQTAPVFDVTPMSVEEFLVTLAVFADGAPRVLGIQANASSATSENIAHPSGCVSDVIAMRHAVRPFTAAEVLPPFIALKTLDIRLHHLPDGFFQSLPLSLETLRLCLPAPLSAQDLTSAEAMSGIPRLRNLRCMALSYAGDPMAVMQQHLAIMRVLPLDCELRQLV